MARLIKLTKETLDARARSREAADEMADIRAKIDSRLRVLKARARGSPLPQARAPQVTYDSNSDLENELLTATDTESAQVDELEERVYTPEEIDEMLQDAVETGDNDTSQENE